MNNNIQHDLETFVGNKKYYYGPKFEVFMDQDSKAGWNWPTLFVPVLWMAYRKMYVQAAIYIAISEVLSYIGSKFAFGGALSFALWIGFPIFANYLYFRHAESKINSVTITANGEDREEEIRRLGGTSVASIFVFLVLSVVISSVTLYVTGGLNDIMNLINI